jgi:hypothetical protein
LEDLSSVARAGKEENSKVCSAITLSSKNMNKNIKLKTEFEPGN